MFVLRRVQPERLRLSRAMSHTKQKPLLMDKIVGYFIGFSCLLLAVDVAHNSYPAALLCVSSAIVAAMAVPVSRRRRPRRRSTVTWPRPTNEANNAVEQQNFYAGG
ncbi:unnamed protein product [Pelagomonas calceolata]|uniref:Uncharacterized protein n=1 Tax=Pelagomonas calceolata TaxID=35677 RepID=A0A8J2SW41_9STRA|nr:unnamed protein product [Pelagomonas calceolata]